MGVVHLAAPGWTSRTPFAAHKSQLLSLGLVNFRRSLFLCLFLRIRAARARLGPFRTGRDCICSLCALDPKYACDEEGRECERHNSAPISVVLSRAHKDE